MCTDIQQARWGVLKEKSLDFFISINEHHLNPEIFMNINNNWGQNIVEVNIMKSFCLLDYGIKQTRS